MDINISVRAAVRTQVTALTSCFSLLGVLLQIFHRQIISEVRFSKCCRRAPWLLRRQEQNHRLTVPLHYLIRNALERATHLVTHQVASQKGSKSPAREQICRTMQFHFLSLWWLFWISSLGDHLIKRSVWSEVSIKVYMLLPGENSLLPAKSWHVWKIEK